MIHGQLDTDLLDYSHFFVFLQLLEAPQEKSLRLLRMFWVKSRQILPICRYPFLSRCVSEQWFTCISLLTVCSSEIGLYFSYVIYLLEVNFFFYRYKITSHCCAKRGITYSGSWKSMFWNTAVFIPICLIFVSYAQTVLLVHANLVSLFASFKQ